MRYSRYMIKLSTKWFFKWSKKVKLSNKVLLNAVNNIEAGLSVAKLGNHLYKVRIKREHSGKSSGFRTIIVYKEKDRAVFLYGFGKNEKENINKTELRYFKKLGNELLGLTPEQIKRSVELKILSDLEAGK